MVYRTLASNPFEFAVVAALRAKQLMAGCVPRVAPARKLTSTATLEVYAGRVVRVPDEPPVPPAT
jgi:DNA-directed RNA polymerase subunit K/omega